MKPSDPVNPVPRQIDEFRDGHYASSYFPGESIRFRTICMMAQGMLADESGGGVASPYPKEALAERAIEVADELIKQSGEFGGMTQEEIDGEVRK